MRHGALPAFYGVRMLGVTLFVISFSATCVGAGVVDSDSSEDRSSVGALLSDVEDRGHSMAHSAFSAPNLSFNRPFSYFVSRLLLCCWAG